MKLTNLIRLGGLVAMAGGATYATLGLVTWLCIPNCPRSLGYIVSVFFLLLTVGAMAAIAALHALQKERYGWVGTVVSLIALIGVALILVGGLGEVLASSPSDRTTDWYYMTGTFLLVGLLVATIGILALGVVTAAAGVLPWWCGVALIAGSPLVGFFLYLFSPVEDLLLGVPWALAGYAIFRGGTRQTERPSRVR